MEPAKTTQPVAVTHDQLGIHEGQEYEGHVEYDLGNLAAFAPAPVDASRFAESPDAACLELATQLTQSLLGRVFALPSQAAPVGRMVQLPPPTTPLPRAKPLPKPRVPTKWERFAQSKGIVKHKRSKVEFDEQAGEWRRRFGYKRVNDDNEIPVIEARPDDKVGEDPFTQLKAEKREKQRAQDKRHAANAKAAAGARPVLPPTLRLAASLPEHGRGRPAKRSELHSDVKSAAQRAAVSTGSLGKHDRQVAGEEEAGVRNLSGKRRKFLPVVTPDGAERGSTQSVVNKLLRSKADDILDVDRAVSVLESQKRQQARGQQARENKAAAAGPEEAGIDDKRRAGGRGKHAGRGHASGAGGRGRGGAKPSQRGRGGGAGRSRGDRGSGQARAGRGAAGGGGRQSSGGGRGGGRGAGRGAGRGRGRR